MVGEKITAFVAEQEANKEQRDEGKRYTKAELIAKVRALLAKRPNAAVLPKRQRPLPKKQRR